MLPLAERGGWIVVNINTVSGNIIPMNMEMINNNFFHGMIQKCGGQKRHRQRGFNSQVGKLITEIPVTHAMT